MLKKGIFVCIIALSAINLNAQNTGQVTLKNGSVIRGKIVEIVPDRNVTINDNAGNTWVYKMSEVVKIEDVKSTISSSTGFHPGLVNMTSIGFLAGSQSSNYVAPFSILTSFGYRSALGLYTGLVTGLEFINVSHIPLMFDFQYSFFQGDVSPVAIVRGGYTFPGKGISEMYGTKYTYSGGPSGAIGVGLKVRSKDIFAWDVSVLYRYMQINYTEDYDWQEYANEYKDVYNRLELRLGIYLGK